MFETNFSTIDWYIVAIYLVGTAIIGVLVNRYIHSVSDYMVGGRGARTALNVATYISTGLGLVTLMYASIDAFSYGFAFVTLAVIGAAVGVFLGTTGFAISRLRQLNLLTIPEYFEKRFNRKVRILAGLICAGAGILNMGLFPKMGATFITYATGLGATDGDSTQIVNLVTSLLIVLVLLYTVVGGMVSVMVTDFLQFGVLSVGLALGIYFCLAAPDLGWSNIVNTLAEHRGEAAFNPFVSPSEGGYGWIWVLFNVLVFFGAQICWAPEASRALTARDPRTARLTFLLSGPGQFIRLAIPALFAMAAFCLISQHAELTQHFFPDGLDGNAQHAAQAMPLLLGKLLPVGLVGLLVAGLMAAFMSTHDSYLLCWSSVLTRDVVGPMMGRELSDRTQIKITRLIIVLIGAFLLIWGIWYPLPDSVWIYMSVTGTIYISGSMAAIIGGMYWRRASSAGAMAALLCGLLAVVGLLADLPQIKPYFPQWLTPPLLGLFTYALCAVVFVVVSLLVPDREPSALRED